MSLSLLTAEEIKAFRAGAKLSQVKLAETLGISRRTVEDWEAGINPPPMMLRYVFAAMVAGLEPWSVYAKPAPAGPVSSPSLIPGAKAKPPASKPQPLAEESVPLAVQLGPAAVAPGSRAEEAVSARNAKAPRIAAGAVA